MLGLFTRAWAILYKHVLLCLKTSAYVYDSFKLTAKNEKKKKRLSRNIFTIDFRLCERGLYI